MKIQRNKYPDKYYHPNGSWHILLNVGYNCVLFKNSRGIIRIDNYLQWGPTVENDLTRKYPHIVKLLNLR